MKIKQIRLSKKISVPEFVKLTGIPRRTIQDIEARGDCLVSNAKKIADALNVTMDELCKENT